MSEPAPAKPRKSKRQRFLDTAQPRTRRVIRAIRLLSKCSNPASYSYSENDVQLIFNTLQTELDLAKLCFERGRDSEIRFRLESGEEGGEEADPDE